MISSRFYSNLRRGKRDANPLIIYWATDAHVHSGVDSNPDAVDAIGGRRYFYTAGQKLQNFVNEVNSNVPDLVYFSGDVIEDYAYPDSLDLFMSKWSQIDSGIKKELTIGNHDMASGGGLVANTIMADKLGYGNKPLIAGSKYNQSFYLDNGSNKVKIISVDTNMDENGVHSAVTAQTLKQPVRTWVESELLNSTANRIIITSHAGMADVPAHFNMEDHLAFKTMIDAVCLQRPELDLYNFYGHNHVLGISESTTLGENIVSKSLPPVVDNVIGKYTIITISTSGISFEIKDLKYPYPS